MATATAAQLEAIEQYKADVEAATGMTYEQYLEYKAQNRIPKPPSYYAQEELTSIGGTGEREGDLDYAIEEAYNQNIEADKQFFLENPEYYSPDGKVIYQDPINQQIEDYIANKDTGTTTTTAPAPDTNTDNTGATGTGGTTTDPAPDTQTEISEADAAILERLNNPSLVEGATVEPVQQTVQDNEIIQGTQLDPNAVTQPTVQQVESPTATPAATYEAALVGDAPTVDTAQGTVSQDAQMQASQIDPNTGQMVAVTGDDPNAVQAAQIDPNVGQAEAAQGEVSQDALAQAAQGVEDAQKIALLEQFDQDIQNMPVDPRATVQEQYNQLMDFDAGEVPTWAQGALETANAEMARRGITNTTIAANATFTAITRAAMPIAQQDAKVFQTMQMTQMSMKQASTFLRAGHLAELNRTNLANRQQAAIQNAQAHLAIDMANLDNEQQTAIFNATSALQAATTNAGFQQQAAMETARNALSMNLANLSAENQAAIQNAQAALSVASQNLNARQQAAQYNAQAFLSMDMANLDARQQSAIIDAQSRLQALMTDAAATNAAAQFNASSENQVTQFFAQMANNTAMFNSSQTLSNDQFIASMQDMRDQFNTKLANEIEQANVIYQRQINTQYTADQNQANLINAQNLLNISNQAMADYLTLFRDDAHYAFMTSENALDRATKLAQQKMINDTNILLFDKNAAFQDSQATGDLVGSLAAQFGSALIGDLFDGGGFLSGIFGGGSSGTNLTTNDNPDSAGFTGG